jgi:hypothetical protein
MKMKKLLVVTGLVFGLLIASILQSSAQTMNGCMNKRTGALRIAIPSRPCTKFETAISWNQVGPPGLKGDKGDKGDTGATGATGLQGPPGVANGIKTATHGYVDENGGYLSGTNWWSYKQTQDSWRFCYHILLQNMTSGPTPVCVADSLHMVIAPDFYDHHVAEHWNSEWNSWEVDICYTLFDTNSDFDLGNAARGWTRFICVQNF